MATQQEKGLTSAKALAFTASTPVEISITRPVLLGHNNVQSPKATTGGHGKQLCMIATTTEKKTVTLICTGDNTNHFAELMQRQPEENYDGTPVYRIKNASLKQQQDKQNVHNFSLTQDGSVYEMNNSSTMTLTDDRAKNICSPVFKPPGHFISNYEELFALKADAVFSVPMYIDERPAHKSNGTNFGYYRLVGSINNDYIITVIHRVDELCTTFNQACPGGGVAVNIRKVRLLMFVGCVRGCGFPHSICVRAETDGPEKTKSDVL
jgi:hypothetical protein